MNIQSTLLMPAVSEHPLPIFHSQIARSGETISVIATIILGSASEHQISAAAQEGLEQFFSVQSAAYPEAIIHLVDLTILEDVEEKIEHALLKAHRGDAIVYMCKTIAILKTTIAAVGLEARPDEMT